MHGREGLRADGTLRKALNDAEAFMTLRFKLPPGGDVPPITAARRMGLSLDAFRDALPELVARGFPQADETTGNFDLDAIDVWRRTRNPHLFPDSLDLSENPLRSPVTASDASEVIRQKIIAGLTPARNP
jgi:hypothetical protein